MKEEKEGAEEIDLNEEEEQALEAAWEKIYKEEQNTPGKISTKSQGSMGQVQSSFPGFTGTIKDKIGRQRCYVNGAQVGCNKPEQPKQPKQPKAQGQQAQNKPQQPAQQQAQTQGNPQAQGKKDQLNNVIDNVLGGKASPKEERIAKNIQSNNVTDYQFDEQQKEQEQQWHKEFLDWNSKSRQDPETPIKPQEAGLVARFITGLLNPIMGGVDYISQLKLPQEPGADPDKFSDLTRKYEIYFNSISPNKELNTEAAMITARMFGSQAFKILRIIKTQPSKGTPQPPKIKEKKPSKVTKPTKEKKPPKKGYQKQFKECNLAMNLEEVYPL